VSVERLLAESDVLSVHVDYRERNRHIVNEQSLGKCKPGLLFINTSRGFVVDPAGLAAFLRKNPHALAMVDVHDPFEPVTADYPLLGVPNARLTPHLASGTAQAKRNMSWVVRDVWRVLVGEEPENAAPK
jgi:D-3-phosphoglycerate dehydrogenase